MTHEVFKTYQPQARAQAMIDTADEIIQEYLAQDLRLTLQYER